MDPHAKSKQLNFLLKFSPILIGVLIPNATYAGCTDPPHCDEHKLRLIAGGQFTHRSPEMHYHKNIESLPSGGTIQEDYAGNRYLPFPFMKLEYHINQASFVSLTYNKDETDTSVLVRKKVNFLFFPLDLAIIAPLRIETQSLKVSYNRTLFQSNGFEFGGSLGIHILNYYGEIGIPVKDNTIKNVIVPLPNIGIFASWLHSEHVTSRLKTDYLPLRVNSIDGSVAEIDFSLEYQYSPTWMIGAGYRYSSIKLELDRESYRANGSYIAHGPTIFMGVSF